jgi:hypothetical protein
LINFVVVHLFTFFLQRHRSEQTAIERQMTMLPIAERVGELDHYLIAGIDQVQRAAIVEQIDLAPPFVGSDRVDGSGCALCDRSASSVPAWTKAVPSALFDRYREAYRRVAQSRICTTVLLLAQKRAMGGEAAFALSPAKVENHFDRTFVKL